jgi:hypothetical protein
MIPLSLANLLMVMVVKQFEMSLWWLLPGSCALFAAWGLISASLRSAEERSRPGYVKRKKAAAAHGGHGHGGHGHAAAH